MLPYNWAAMKYNEYSLSIFVLCLQWWWGLENKIELCVELLYCPKYSRLQQQLPAFGVCQGWLKANNISKPIMSQVLLLFKKESIDIFHCEEKSFLHTEIVIEDLVMRRRKSPPLLLVGLPNATNKKHYLSLNK